MHPASIPGGHRLCLLVVFIVSGILAAGCSASPPQTLACYDEGRPTSTAWIIRIDGAGAEMIDAQEGRPLGSVLTSERSYKITFPGKKDAWYRMQFEIDRFTSKGTLEMGERKHEETLRISIVCEGGQAPKL